jgi:peptidoglycan/LPS O-acetylase OafA/YrhL
MLQRIESTAGAITQANVDKDHWAVLSATRLALALIVVNCHYRLVLPAPFEHPASHLAIALGGTAAVYGFLLISGFSIASSIDQAPNGFYQRRIARLWPVLAFGVVLELGWLVFAHDGIFKIDWLIAAAPTLVFANGFVATLWLVPTWSLSMEASYYLAAPFLWRAVWPVWIIGAISCLVHVFNQDLGIGPYAFLNFGIGALACFWAWGTGLLAYRYREHPAIVALVMLIGPLMIGNYGAGDGLLASLTWGATAFAVVFGGSITLSDRSRKIATFLGDVSYPMFIVHLSTMNIAHKLLGTNTWPLMMACVLAMATLVLFTVDRPLRLRISAIKLPAWRIESASAALIALLAAACVLAFYASRA